MQINSREIKLGRGACITVCFVLAQFLMSHLLFAEEEYKPKCQDIFGLMEGMGDSSEINVFYDVRQFSDLMEIVQKHPMNIYNAAQRFIAVVKAFGTEDIFVPGVGRPVKKYNILSEPNEYNNGRYIVGLEEQIGYFVDSIEGQAAGQTKASLFVGPAGTGKTLFGDILYEVQKRLTLTDDRFKIYTFKWVDLDEIPKLKGLFIRGEFKSPMNESPFALLYEGMQRTLLDNINPINLGAGDPNPRIGALNPQDEEIRTAIMEYYGAKSPAQILEALNKHVKLIRYVPTQSNMPRIDVQGENYSTDGLFIGKDTVRALKVGNMALAFDFGKMALSHNSLAILDEFFRNPPPLLQIFLQILESGRVSIDKSPDYPLDTVFTIMSNTESVVAVSENENLKALMDRLYKIQFLWPTNPSHVAETMLMMLDRGKSDLNSGRVFVEPLEVNGGEEDVEIEPKHINFSEVFPDRKQGKVAKTTDYRYKVYVKMLDRDVFINPHVLQFMSYMVAATRMVTDPSKLGGQQKALSVAQTSLFTDPITRIKYLTGNYDAKSVATEQELKKASELLMEGSVGISTRDATKWLEDSLHEAMLEGNEGELTVDIAISVLLRHLRTHTIAYTGGEATRMEWENLAKAITERLILPEMKQDINTAMSGEIDVKVVYEQIFNEMLALAKDPNATQYTYGTGTQTYTIDKERLDAVRRIYKETIGKSLNIYTLTGFSVFSNHEVGQDNDVYDQNLINAIKAYYVDISMKSIEVARTSFDRQSNTEVVRGLEALGYSKRGAIQVINWVQNVEKKADQTR